MEALRGGSIKVAVGFGKILSRDKTPWYGSQKNSLCKKETPQKVPI